ncbi:15-hydroxyprostaglandin dehydrogenase NAD(+)-like [Vespula squamosa]|uniref:15-hydroxyprostaglandin dehydrogenase [NAD(+)] n=1 Tax=Vespula squamosa TaxID=30214 RepID=A0ABD2ADN9_VESSQ
MQIKDKRAIVTGAASKLGLAFSRELLRNGVTKVLMIDNREKEGTEAMDILNFEFGRNRAIFLLCDVTRSTDFNGSEKSFAIVTFKDAINILGGLDILINNASVINETDFVKAIDVNVTALIRSTLLGIQQMRRDSGGKGGVVLNVSSIAGLCALPQLPVYSTTKHAVQPYHYQRTKVRIIVLCPGLTEANHEDFSSDFMDPRKYQPRRVESIAHGLIYAIRCAQNGSIWISEQDKPVYEVQLSDSLPQKTDQAEEQQS